MSLTIKLALEEEREVINNINQALEKLDLAITTAGHSEALTVESAAIISDYIDYEISVEDVNAMDEYKNRLKALYNNLNGYIFKQFKSFSPLIDLTNDYKIKELENLKTALSSGKLVPKKLVTDKDAARLNAKLGPFYATGYSFKSGPADMVTYIKGILAIGNRSGKYFKGLQSMYEALSTDKEIPKLNGITNIARSLTGVTNIANRKYKITDFRLSILTSWLGGNANLLFVSKNSKGAFKVYTDTYVVNSYPKVGVATTDQIIKLIDAGIQLKKELAVAHKELGFIIKKFSRDNSIALLDSGANDNSRQFLLANFTKSVVKVLITTYVNLATMDNIIELYVKTVTQKG